MIAHSRSSQFIYKGQSFKNELEAKTAVFFDGMGVLWAYETEGYALPDGSWFMPSFVSLESGVFIDVYPQAITQTHIEKCKQLVCITERKVLVRCGDLGVTAFHTFHLSGDHEVWESEPLEELKKTWFWPAMSTALDFDFSLPEHPGAFS